MDTIKSGRFEDTNKMFISPDIYDFRVTEKNSKLWVNKNCLRIERKKIII